METESIVKMKKRNLYGFAQPIYDTIGKGFNNTRCADPYIAGKLFELLSPKINGLYMDIGCGTGNYTIALADMDLSFYGVEPSENMLQIAKSQNSVINWLLANAEHIPVSDQFFDGAMATLTIHHWTNINKSFIEIYRVLKDDGRFVIFTASPQQMGGYWLNHYFPKMMQDAILQMPPIEFIAEAMAKAGFIISGKEKYFVSDDLKDLFLYSGKNKPEIYLEEDVRSGISSFSALANTKEVTNGLLKLKNDLQSGEFNTVKEKFNNDLGDYLFITALKL